MVLTEVSVGHILESCTLLSLDSLIGTDSKGENKTLPSLQHETKALFLCVWNTMIRWILI